MHKDLPINTNYSPLKFFSLVFVLSIPFWILGAMFPDVPKSLPIQLPISALMTFCPLIAAAILVYKQQKMQGVQELLKQVFDVQKINNKRWYLPIILLMLVIALLSYGYAAVEGVKLTESETPVVAVLIFFVVYFIGAIGEELGWSGYVIHP
jgi:uncharacterized protein